MSKALQRAKTQYNGMILLSSYIERLYVQASIGQALGDFPTNEQAEKYKTMFEDVTLIQGIFEQSHTLTENQLHKLLSIYEEVNGGFQSFFPQGDATLTEKVAIIAASFYGERHLNGKIIVLSKLYDAEISTDFEKRITFYNERIKLMDYVVLALTKGDALKPELHEQLEAWYGNITSIKEHVVKDLTMVPQLIAVQ